MSVSDDYRAAVELIRGWGFHVTEWNGCYGRSNGGGWSAGRPVGHVNHHYVCSLNPDQGYINNLVGNLANGSVVNWFADVHGVAYLIGTGPMNHAGTGNQSVLDRTRNDQPPPGPASSAGSISGNAHYSGTECQHPGDSTPWPGPMLDVMVAINAAEFLVWGYSADRAINHFEWTSRKIDMSAGGGPSDNWAGDELRRRVAARMAGEPSDWWDELSDDEKAQLLADVAAIKDTLGKFHPKAVHWGDGAAHYYSFGDGTYIQVPDPMGDGGVHNDFRANLEQAGIELVEYAGAGAPLADPYLFGNRIPWSDRP
jgi:hypothetical protein